MSDSDILIVGAGLAGLACAGDVQVRGTAVRLVDKARGVGGRASTRRWDEVRVDHGAPYFTARGERLQNLAEEWERAGWLRVWCRGFPVWEGAVKERPPGHPRYAPLDGMSRLAKHLAQGLEVHTQAQVTALRREQGRWTAQCADGRAFTAPRIVLNLPAAQIVPLVRDFLPTTPLESVAFGPAWSVLLRLEQDLTVEWPALELRHPVLAWAARDHTKRRAGAPPTLVAHAQGAWSRERLEDDPETVTGQVLAALRDTIGPIAVRAAQAHRWRYSQPTVTFPATHYWNPELSLGWCGDWCGGPRVEGALESGWDLARTLSSEWRTASREQSGR